MRWLLIGLIVAVLSLSAVVFGSPQLPLMVCAPEAQ